MYPYDSEKQILERISSQLGNRGGGQAEARMLQLLHAIAEKLHALPCTGAHAVYDPVAKPGDWYADPYTYGVWLRKGSDWYIVQSDGVFGVCRRDNRYTTREPQCERVRGDYTSLAEAIAAAPTF